MDRSAVLTKEIQFRAVRAIWGSGKDMESQWLGHAVGAEAPEELVGYELIAGLSILYVNTEVFQRGIQEGLIQPPGDAVPRLRFEDVWHMAGMRRCEALRQAILETTPELLEQAHKRAARMERNIRIRVYDAFHERSVERDTGKKQAYLMEEILLDPVAFQVLELHTAPEEQCNAQFYFLTFRDGMGYAECIEQLAHRAYCHFLSVEDLYSVYKQNGFYDMDRFCQRLLRLEFDFIKR